MITFDYGYIVEGKLSAEDKKKLKPSDYGLPEKKKFPMPDADHVKAAIRMFNHVDKKDEVELARNINKKIKAFGVEVSVSKENRFSKYYNTSEKKEVKVEDYLYFYADPSVDSFPLMEGEFNDIFNKFKQSNDENKETKLQALIRTLYAKSPEQIVEGTPNLLAYLRVIFICGLGAINPILFCIGLMADLFIKIGVDKKESAKMVVCFKNEMAATKKKMDSTKDPQKKARLKAYYDKLNEAYKKIDEHYTGLLTDEEIDKKYEEENSSDDDYEDDSNDDSSGSKDDDDFDDFDLDFDDMDNFDESTIRSIVNISRLVEIRENQSVIDRAKLNTILKCRPDLIGLLYETATKFPNVINMNTLRESIISTLDDKSNGSYLERADLENYLELARGYEYSNDVFHYTVQTEQHRLECEVEAADTVSELANFCAQSNYMVEASFSNTIKMATTKLQRFLQKLSDKDKEISKNIDVSANNFKKAAEKSLTNDNRESIIKGSILPSASKTLKFTLGSIGTAIILDPVIAIIGALGWLGVNAKYKHKERQMILDEIETELKMCEEYIDIAKSKNDMKSLRKLYTIQRELERQRQRIKYNMKVKFGQKYYDADSTLNDMK